MSRARSHQPGTVASLKRKLAEKDALLAEKEALLIERERVIAVRDAELYAKTLQIEHIKAQLAVLRRARFGRSSEKLDSEIEQLELVLGELEEGVAEAQERTARAKTDGQVGERRKNTDRKPFGRKPLPDHLPRERVVHEPALACGSCGGTVLRKIGEDVTEVLEYVPSSFKVIEHVRPKLSNLLGDFASSAAVVSDRARSCGARPARACRCRKVCRCVAAAPADRDLSTRWR